MCPKTKPLIHPHSASLDLVCNCWRFQFQSLQPKPELASKSRTSILSAVLSIGWVWTLMTHKLYFLVKWPLSISLVHHWSSYHEKSWSTYTTLALPILIFPHLRQIKIHQDPSINTCKWGGFYATVYSWVQRSNTFLWILFSSSPVLVSISISI
jgi:hypothetical protein